MHRIWLIPQLCPDLPMDLIYCIIGPLICLLETVHFTRSDIENGIASKPGLFNPYFTPICSILPYNTVDSINFVYDDCLHTMRLREPALHRFTFPKAYIVCPETGTYYAIFYDPALTLHKLMHKQK